MRPSSAPDTSWKAKLEGAGFKVIDRYYDLGAENPDSDESPDDPPAQRSSTPYTDASLGLPMAPPRIRP